MKIYAAFMLVCSFVAAYNNPFYDDEAHLNGGTFIFGTVLPPKAKQRLPPDQGLPPSEVKIEPFYIDKFAVTNARYATFVAETDYTTETERFKWSFVLENLLDEETLAIADAEDGVGRVKDARHWVGVLGADWRHPEGPNSALSDERMAHPVVHVTYTDALEYCKWAGRRLPTEKEWEFAARGGKSGPYPWGKSLLTAQDSFNIWQGDFPKKNTMEDGYLGTAPVNAYTPNDYGIYSMVGNVWEWVSGGKPDKRILKGGSFVDTLDGRANHAVTVATRMTTTADSGGASTGFRCARSVDKEEEDDEEEARKRKFKRSRKKGAKKGGGESDASVGAQGEEL